MPIRRELRPLYPAHWPELSRPVRFERAGGSYARTWVTRGLGGALFWRVGHLDAVAEGPFPGAA